MPAVMIYVQHLLGIGHLMRARLIAEALAEAGCDVHLVTGGMPIGGRMPAACALSSCRRSASPMQASCRCETAITFPSTTPIARRRDLLLATFAGVAPDAVIFETFPFDAVRCASS